MKLIVALLLSLNVVNGFVTAIAKFIHKKNSLRRDVLKATGPRAIPTYATISQGSYYAYGSGVRLDPKGGDYYTCEDECERRGAECWGVQTTFGCTDRLGCCQALIMSDPGNIDRIGTVGTTVYQKVTQAWQEEPKRCWGLTYDGDATVVGECETNCAWDSECDVYQWMRFDDGTDDQCWRGKSNDCTGASSTVLEGYRKQVVEWIPEERQCMGLVWDEYVRSQANCQGNCELDVDCEIFQWFQKEQGCYRGKSDVCTGQFPPSASARKQIVDSQAQRRLLRMTN
jgi:hypothetical protein